MIARALTHAARCASDLVARYGGEEFAMLLPNSSGEDAINAAQRILSDIRSLAIPHGETAHGIVAVSLGVVSLAPSNRYVPEYLLRQADLALYRAKNAGRNCVKSASADATIGEGVHLSGRWRNASRVNPDLGNDCIPRQEYLPLSEQLKPQAAIRSSFSGNGIRIDTP